MNTMLFFSVVSLLLMISILHFYWAFGGRWGVYSAMPEQYRASYFDPKMAFKIKLATIIVAIGLICFAAIIALKYFELNYFIQKEYTDIAVKIIGVIFLVRAIGDFNYFGTFKKKSDDVFAKNDSIIYVPICLFLGISLFLIA